MNNILIYNLALRLSDATRWSELSRSANSVLARGTVVAPIIGYLILYNTQLKPYLDVTLPPEVSENTLLRDLFNYRLEFLFFGLIIYGFGILIYSRFVPRQIRDFDGVSSYVSAMEDVKTRNLVVRHFDSIVRLFLEANTGERRSRYFDRLSLSFPRYAAKPLHLLVERCTESAHGQVVGALNEYKTGSGELRTDGVMEVLEKTDSPSRSFSSPIRGEANSRSKEVFYNYYRSINFSRFSTRFIV